MGSIREQFDRARAAAMRLERVVLLIEAGGEDARRGTGKPPGISDPTAARALARIQRMADLLEERNALEAEIAEAREIIEGTGRALGAAYADVLAAYYLEAKSWGETAEALGIAKSTAILRRDMACDWIDSAGIAHARAGTWLAI